MNRFVPRSHLTPPEFRISNTEKVFDRNSIFDKQTSCPIFFIQTYEYKLIILLSRAIDADEKVPEVGDEDEDDVITRPDGEFEQL